MMVGHHAGHSPNDYERLRQTLETLSPCQEYAKYDELFLAWSRLWINPAQTMEILQRNVKQGDWAIGHIMLANAQNLVATDREDHELAACALENARIADKMQPDNIFARVTLLACYVSAIELAQRSGDVSAVEDWCKTASGIADSLRDCSEHWQVPGTIASFLELTDASSTADAWRRVHGDWWVACRVPAFDARNALAPKLADGDEDLEDRPFAAVARAKLLALTGKSDQARVEYRRIVDSTVHVPARAFALEILSLLGEDNVQDEARRILREVHRDNPDALDNHFSCLPGRLKFLAGQLTRDQFLESVKGSRMGLCYAHYLIGLRQLANYDPGRATESFDQSVATGQTYVPEYYWAKLLRKRIADGNLPVTGK